MMLINCNLLIGFSKLFLLKPRWFALGQPMLIAGDLNADPAVVPCLAKGISAGRCVDLALAYSLGAGLAPDVICRFNREEVLVLVGIFCGLSWCSGCFSGLLCH